ncbi:hypothetical protein LCGC14_2510530 [marine sediment metagenome]|uniref:Uncharacterized protein n=1 Tax=marine sediment metagenome TaxID=412755 RepID=A0A0F9BM57_9ZZZZ
MPALAFRTTIPKPDDPRILNRMAEAIRKGHPIATAGTLAGIGETTAKDWYAAGEQALVQAETTGEDPGALGSHALFASVVKQAEAELVDAKLGVIDEATRAKGGWVAAMTLLERRRPRDFGKQQYLEVEQRNYNIHLTLPDGALPALLRLRGRELPQLPEPEQALE